MLVDKASQKAERRQSKRDPEAVLRKRAKKRAKYLAKLVQDGERTPLLVSLAARHHAPSIALRGA